MTPALDVHVARKSERREALTLVLQTVEADQRAPLVDSLARLKGEPLGPFDALVVARQRGVLTAAAWAQPQPGKIASLWLPEGIKGASPPMDIATALLNRIALTTDRAGVALTQALLENEREERVDALLANAYRRVAELLYLEWTPGEAPLAEEEVPPISFLSYDVCQRARLEAILSETYCQTLDCPELDGMRSIQDIVKGYESSGVYDPNLWWILQQSGHDVGVLLLTEHPDPLQLELTYMGVAPQARGARLGEVAVSHAQRTAQRRGAGRMVLAVDARNDPALRIYRAAGFHAWTRRFVYLRSLSG